MSECETKERKDINMGKERRKKGEKRSGRNDKETVKKKVDK